MVTSKAINAPVNKDLETIQEQVRNSEIHRRTNSSISFEYELNDKSAKSKLLKAAKRTPLDVEENALSSNLVFSAGSWYHSVLPAVIYWNEVKEDKTCKIDEYEVKIGGVKHGNDKNGKHVNTQVVFYADRDKIVCHLYNTTQLILVNGHGYQRFIDLFLDLSLPPRLRRVFKTLNNSTKRFGKSLAQKQ